MRVTLVHNPSAGDERHSAEALRTLLTNAGHDLVAYRSTKSSGWEDALREPGDLVVVAGGDGTVRKVLKELAANPTAVTLLPIGSANNIARSLGYGDEGVDTLVRGWARGHTRPYDVGEATGPVGTMRFVESIGGGVFAEVLARAERTDADPDGEGKVDFGLRLLRDVIEDAPELPWELDVDGADLSGEFVAVEAMNIRETGPNILLAPRADPGDRRLDLVRIRSEHRAALAAYVDARLAGRQPEPLDLAAEQGTQLRMRSPRTSPLRVDDELWPREVEASGDGIIVATAGGPPLELLVPAI